MPQADPHLGVAKELLLRSRGREGVFVLNNLITLL